MKKMLKVLFQFALTAAVAPGAIAYQIYADPETWTYSSVKGKLLLIGALPFILPVSIPFAVLLLGKKTQLHITALMTGGKVTGWEIERKDRE